MRASNPLNSQSGRAGLAAAMLLLSCSIGMAQPPSNSFGRNRPNRPTISPYLNLLNNAGGNEALNYYNFVRPEQEFRRAATNFSAQLGALQTDVRQLQQGPGAGEPAAVQPLVTGRMAPTGHRATFGNVGGYFPDSSRSSSGAARFSAPRR